MAPGTSVILVLLLIVSALSKKFSPSSFKGLQPRVTAVKLPGGLMEVVEQETCSKGVLRLTCRSLRALLVVLEAGYVPGRSDLCGRLSEESRGLKNLRKTQFRHLRGNYIADATESEEEGHQDDLRISMNRRCSGLQHCRFNINADHPEASFWTPANVRLKYACIPEAAIGKYCNRKLSVVGGEGGYLKSPGYPLYYTGGTSCGWIFESQPGQRISLTLHDLNIRKIIHGFGTIGAEQDGSCVDVIRVRENGITLLESCGTAAGLQVISESNVITLDLIALSNLYPSRGFLLQYRAIGCPEIEAPDGSYIVNDTGEVKTFLCKTGTVFPDTKTRSKLIRCKNGLWSGVRELTSCVDTAAAIQKVQGGTTGRYTASLTDEPGSFGGFRTSGGIVERSSDRVSSSSNIKDPAMADRIDDVDIVIPTLLIALLLIGNVVIVYAIFQYRKRKQASIGRVVDGAEEMSLRTAVEGSLQV